MDEPSPAPQWQHDGTGAQDTRWGWLRHAGAWLCGAVSGPGECAGARRLFFVLLGVTYAVAFVSFGVQAPGLVGSRGIEPAAVFLEQVHAQLGADAYWRVPTVFWWDASDGALRLVWCLGTALSVALAAGFTPRLCAAALWLLYLSIASVGGVFLSFQWDALLLETGFLAVLLAPSGLLFGRWSERVPRAPLLLVRWLLFRLMFASGVVKLDADAETWLDGSALLYHYWTQPLPHRWSYFVDQLPAVVHRVSTWVMFAIELVLPWFVFGPRRMRLLACASFTALMLLITATGNYGFFNLLTLCLCAMLLDDRALAKLRSPLRTSAAEPIRLTPGRLWPCVALVLAFVVVPLTGARMLQRFGWIGPLPELFAPIERVARPTSSFNSYGLFARMTTSRPEIVVEGSLDGTTWVRYDFRWKPTDLDRPPQWAGPHMPRVDWQMWFAALGTWEYNRWYLQFVQRLLEGEPNVTRLLRENPFQDEPPRYIRSTRFEYTFSEPDELRKQGVWWTRTTVGPYCPTLMLVNGQLARAP